MSEKRSLPEKKSDNIYKIFNMNKIKGINDLILKRRSIFAFSPEPVKDEDLRLLFDAARKAASSSNTQPWRFIYAKQSEPIKYKRLFDLLDEGNKIWADSAPVLILSLTEVISSYKGRVNPYAFHDLGMATANLMLQAVYMGLATHPMGGYDKEKARITLNIPDSIEPVAMIALGYPGVNHNFPEKIKKRIAEAGIRKEINTFAFNGEFGLRDE